MALVALFSSVVEASTKVGFCDLCTTNTAYSQIAKSIADQNTDEVYIINYRSQQIRKFLADSIPEEPGMPAQIWVYEVAVSSGLKADFEDYAQARSAVGVIMTDLTFPEDLATSAYQLAGREYLINDFLTRFAEQNVGVFDRLASTLVVLTNAINLTNINSVYTVNFKNNDKITIKVTGIKKIPITGKIILEFIVVSAVDADGNPVKFDSSGYTSGERRFELGGQMALSEFLQAAARTGIPVYYSGSTFRPRVRIIDCSSDAPAKGKCVEPVPETIMY